ncbi:MAG: rhomboid family intramembrane serine protease [Chloroflexota bacterium]|nr:rhomboid family intramembrane serine protease [Chloroflexota bacterium]
MQSYTSATDSAPDRPVWLQLPTFRPRVTQILLGILVLIFLYGELNLGGPQTNDRLFNLGAKNNAAILHGEYWRLLTAMFLHAGFLHIAFNGYALLIFGQQVESFYGPWRFLAIYFIAGLAGSIASFAFSPHDSVGASGAIFGIIGALGAYFFFHRRLLGGAGRAQLLNAVAMIVLNLLLGASQANTIDNFAHVGGLIAGGVAAVLLAPRYTPGRALDSDVRLLEDRLPAWAPWAITLALFAIEGFLFAGALRIAPGGE